MGIEFLIAYPWLIFLAASIVVLLIFKRKYYFFYDHRLLFVVGLAYSRALTNYAIISVIVWYFTYYGSDLVMSSILSNIQGSLSSIFVIFMAQAADSYVGKFHTLLFSNTAYIGGLMLLWLFNPYDVKWLVVISIVLLALGTSGDILLQVVLENLVIEIDRPQDQTQETRSIVFLKAQETRSIARAEIWSRIAYVCGAISAILWVAPDAIGGVHSTWRSSFLICICTITVALIVFCKGHNMYDRDELIERPLMIFLRECNVGIKKLLKGTTWRLTNSFLRQGSSPQNVETQSVEIVGNMHDRSPLRQDTEAREKDRVVVKSLIRIFPMWGMYFVVALISATGSTFFLQQYNNLNTSSKILVQIYSVLQDLSCFAIPFLYRWICKWVNGASGLEAPPSPSQFETPMGIELLTSPMEASALPGTPSHEISEISPSPSLIEAPMSQELLTHMESDALPGTSSHDISKASILPSLIEGLTGQEPLASIVEALPLSRTPLVYATNEKVKIGVGMLCGIISCIMAWQVEVYRLKKVNHLVDKDANTSMNFLWLVPQFCVLGFMEGLTWEGMFNFYTSQVTQQPLNRYGEEYIEIVLGLGKLLSIFLILIFQRLGWFGDTINNSRLDKYYIFLVSLCTANLIAYCCVAKFYYKDSGKPQNLGNENLNQDNQTEPQTGQEIAG